MSANSKIEWTDHTFNPWEGCQKVGPGCDHCYAETRNARFAGGTSINWGPGAPRRRTTAANWNKPLQWNAAAADFAAKNGGRRQRVFCASLADVFDNAVDIAWLADLLDLIRTTRNMDWLLLTKRIGNWRPRIEEVIHYVLNHDEADVSLAGWLYAWLDGTHAPRHIGIGATIVNQAEADRDIPKLLAIPAAMRFLSMEPLLGPVDLTDSGLVYHDCVNWNNTGMDPETGQYECCRACDYTGKTADIGIDWVIVGGESGAAARPMHPLWARHLRDQCLTAHIPFFFKQWGEWAPGAPQYPITREEEEQFEELDFGADIAQLELNGDIAFGYQPRSGAWLMTRSGKKAAGRLLDGQAWDEVPTDSGCA